MSDLQQQVQKLIEKAVKADDSGDALRFSQAALNAANTLHALEPLGGTR
jgi:membrane protease subunit (stomatin/prohibitin family)